MPTERSMKQLLMSQMREQLIMISPVSSTKRSPLCPVMACFWMSMAMQGKYKGPSLVTFFTKSILSEEIIALQNPLSKVLANSGVEAPTLVLKISSKATGVSDTFSMRRGYEQYHPLKRRFQTGIVISVEATLCGNMVQNMEGELMLFRLSFPRICALDGVMMENVERLAQFQDFLS